MSTKLNEKMATMSQVIYSDPAKIRSTVTAGKITLENFTVRGWVKTYSGSEEQVIAFLEGAVAGAQMSESLRDAHSKKSVAVKKA